VQQIGLFYSIAAAVVNNPKTGTLSLLNRLCVTIGLLRSCAFVYIAHRFRVTGITCNCEK